jgi:hypothetical protein
LAEQTDPPRWLTIYRRAGKNVWKMFSTARLCIFAALVDTIYCAPGFLLCVIAASISVIASPLLPLQMNSRTYLHGRNFKTLIQTGEHVRNTIADVAKRIRHDI